MKDELKYISLATTYEIDTSFDSDKFIKLNLRVCHDGTNPNGSTFKVEDMSKAEDSIKNIPILAHVILDENGQPQFGSHDMHLEPDKINNNEYRMIYDEQPLGLVPETNNYHIAPYNGRNYAYVDSFVWKDYSNYGQAIIERDKNINLSMEILVDNYTYDSKTKEYDITDYRYKGITLLGNDVGTGMIDALATTESFSDDNKQKLYTLMSELKEELTKSQSSLEVDDINKTFSQENEKEERILNEEKTKLLEKYNLTIDKLDFKIDDLSIEDLDSKLKEFAEAHKESPKATFSTTYNQKRDALRNALDSTIVTDDNGNVTSETDYWVQDFDENYVYVEKDVWTPDNFDESNGRFAYTFDENTMTVTIAGDFEEMFLVWLTADEKAAHDAQNDNLSALQEQFNVYKETYKTAESDVEVLRTYQAEKLASERKDAEDKVFAMTEFETIHDNDEFKALQEKAKDYSIEDLTDKCFAILGRANANFSLKDSKQKETVKVAVDTTDNKTDPYGGLFETYGNKDN